MGVELGHGQKNRETPYFTNLVSFRGGKLRPEWKIPTAAEVDCHVICCCWRAKSNTI